MHTEKNSNHEKTKNNISIHCSLGGDISFFSSGLKLPVLESTTDDYFRESITTAGVAYATCRVINASVSIVKNSSLNMEPAGVGVTLAVGQVLDPIDDLTERVSDVLVTAITSLGVQKLVFEIGASIAPPILAVLLFICSILILFENKKLALIQKNIMRFILFILILYLLYLYHLLQTTTYKNTSSQKKYLIQTKNWL